MVTGLQSLSLTVEIGMKKPLLMIAMVLITFDAWGDWAIKGEGNFSCPDYVAAKRVNGAKLYSSISWVQGFITGANYQRALPEGSDSFIGQDFPAASIVSWLENHCRANPQDYLSDAAEALVIELKESEKTVKP
jgi:hypothetical protein